MRTTLTGKRLALLLILILSAQDAKIIAPATDSGGIVTEQVAVMETQSEAVEETLYLRRAAR